MRRMEDSSGLKIVSSMTENNTLATKTKAHNDSNANKGVRDEGIFYTVYIYKVVKIVIRRLVSLTKLLKWTLPAQRVNELIAKCTFTNKSRELDRWLLTLHYHKSGNTNSNEKIQRRCIKRWTKRDNFTRVFCCTYICNVMNDHSEIYDAPCTKVYGVCTNVHWLQRFRTLSHLPMFSNVV